MSNSPTPYQNAIRLLFILIHGSEQFSESNSSGAKGIFKGEARLHAMDFWVRYPDYLAYELISIFKETREASLLSSAESIFEDQEPDLRRIPMMRYKYGAYDKIDNTLSILVSKGLVRQEGKKRGDVIQESDYLLMSSAYSKANEISKEFPVLSWYEKRAKLVAKVAGSRGGKALKDRQYEHIAYASTSIRSTIPSITEEVRQQLEGLKNRI